MSPSMTPTAHVAGEFVEVARSTVVLPEPGELIRFSARIPFLAKMSRLMSARTSFSAKIDSSTSIRWVPVS